MMDRKSFKSTCIGIRIAELREKNGLSQTELGKIIGVGVASVSLIENGKRNMTIFSVIDAAMYFDVTTDYILGIN